MADGRSRGVLVATLAGAAVIAVLVVIGIQAAGADSELNEAREACSNEPGWDGTVTMIYRASGEVVRWECGVAEAGADPTP